MREGEARDVSRSTHFVPRGVEGDYGRAVSAVITRGWRDKARAVSVAEAEAGQANKVSTAGADECVCVCVSVCDATMQEMATMALVAMQVLLYSRSSSSSTTRRRGRQE
jgi:hypothetical protein